MTRRDRLRLVRDLPSGIEAVHARFSGHAYDPHRHDEWLVGVTDDGLQEFTCRRTRQRSTPGRVILIEPGELHDGAAGDAGGFSYSMLYLPPSWVRAGLADGPGRDPGFRATLSDDPCLARAIRRACDTLGRPSWIDPRLSASPDREERLRRVGGFTRSCSGRPPERLARDAALDAVLDALRPHFGLPARPEPRTGRDEAVARRARAALHDSLPDEIGADALARAAGAGDRFHLARAFRAAYGTSPHAYLVQLRILHARALLREGDSPADVAAACGFADQSHLGRWFRRAYGLTPAAYRAACRTGLPDRGGAPVP